MGKPLDDVGRSWMTSFSRDEIGRGCWVERRRAFARRGLGSPGPSVRKRNWVSWMNLHGTRAFGHVRRWLCSYEKISLNGHLWSNAHKSPEEPLFRGPSHRHSRTRSGNTKRPIPRSISVAHCGCRCLSIFKWLSIKCIVAVLLSSR